MNFTRRLFFSLCLSLSLLASGPRALCAESEGWHLGDFHLGADMALQGGGSSFSALLRWVPELRFNAERAPSYFGAGFDLGVTAFVNSTRPRFLVGELAVFGSYHLDVHWDFRLFVGAQYWSDGQGTALSLGPKVLYHFDKEPGVMNIDGLYLSYDAVLFSSLANLFSVGVVFELDSPYAPPPRETPVEKPAPKPQVTVSEQREESISKQQQELSAVVDTQRTPNGLIVNLKGDMTFKSGSSKLSDSGADAVGRIGVILARYPTSRIRVDGHSDSTGQQSTNLTLSQARAEGVRSKLIESGVPAQSVLAKGYGTQRPVANNSTAEGRANNRRVEVYIDTPGN